METRMLGSLWPVSSLTIGGGGIGQVWGPTSRDEAVATLREAVESGITLIDVAPTYGKGEAENVVGEAFGGSLPDGVRISTKSHVPQEPDEVYEPLVMALDQSLDRMKLSYVDIFILHSQILPQPDTERQSWTTDLDSFQEKTRPAMEKLVEQGRIGAWGITATQFPQVLETVFSADPAPAVAQMVANVMDAPGDMKWSEGPVRPRQLVAMAAQNGIGVMGIRAVQAGALTDTLDRDLEPGHPARVDFERAAPFRALAAELGESAASLAHRYALSMSGVDTVVLGVKNRAELAECVKSAELGPLPADVITMVDEGMQPLRTD
ncbi:MAG TPA: aldo/keto reductase [Acidimicrobiia bacterium]|nr:aldo/keto reductase [Acidimicrobiia bacterium]